MIKKVAMVFGIVFLLVGLLGFIPGVTTTDSEGHQLLLGLFMVDGVHNVVHILSGVVGLLAAANAKFSKWYLIGFGLVYGLVTVLGLFTDNVLGFLHVNGADTVLHLVLTVGMLGAGFGLKDEDAPLKAAM